MILQEKVETKTFLIFFLRTSFYLTFQFLINSKIINDKEHFDVLDRILNDSEVKPHHLMWSLTLSEMLY